jgi:hypothetical protein
LRIQNFLADPPSAVRELRDFLALEFVRLPIRSLALFGAVCYKGAISAARKTANATTSVTLLKGVKYFDDRSGSPNINAIVHQFLQSLMQTLPLEVAKKRR